MYEKLESCPLCGRHELKNKLICKDYLVSEESFAINECAYCSHRITNPRPVIQELDKYYESEDYISHTGKTKNLINSLYKLARTITLRSKLSLITKYSEPARVLDMGCGTGEFLALLQKNDWEVYGIENNPKAMKKAESLLNIELYDDLNKLDPKENFEVITLWHVLEHIPDIHATMNQLKKHLDRKGTLFIALPNYNSFDALKYKEFWAGYDVPRHLHHFSQESFKFLCKQHELKLKKIIPMKLDAFYISLLSEKYKKNRILKYINFIVTGLKSNTYARKHNKNYSSLIYVLKK